MIRKLLLAIALLVLAAPVVDAGNFGRGFNGRNFRGFNGQNCNNGFNGQNFHGNRGFSVQFGTGGFFANQAFFGPVPVRRGFDQFGNPFTVLSNGQVIGGHHF